MTDILASIQEDVSKVGVIGRLLDHANTSDSGRIAIISETARATYGELYVEARIIAKGLMQRGVEPGDRVGLYMPNGIRFVQTLFGVLMAGAVVVPIHSRYRSDEIRHLIGHGDLRAVCTSGSVSEVDHPTRLHDALKASIEVDHAGTVSSADFPSLRFVMTFDSPLAPHGFVTHNVLDATLTEADHEMISERQSQVQADDVAMILYTSGTTAHPKGCEHSHRGLLQNGITMGRSRFFLTSDDRFWDPLPMFHVGFLLPLIAVMSVRAVMLTMSRVDGTAALEMIENERATWLFPAFPAIANALLNDPSFYERDLASVRMTMCTGTAPMLKRLQSALPLSIQISTYGSTETGGVIVYNLPTDSAEQRATTCGTPMPGNEIQILDPSGGVALPNNLGEILVRGYSTLRRYFRDEAATARAIDNDGWLHTGDLGTLDEGGRLSYQGRLTEMLKVGGENVSPLEVETLIGELPSVALVQVVGVVDSRLDEVVVAFVEVRGDAVLSIDDVVAHCSGRIAAFKIPKHVRFVDEWPMSATKVNKAELRKIITAEMSTNVEG